MKRFGQSPLLGLALKNQNKIFQIMIESIFFFCCLNQNLSKQLIQEFWHWQAFLAGDNIQFKDKLLQKGVFKSLIKLSIRYKTDFVVFNTIMLAISNLARGKTNHKYRQRIVNRCLLGFELLKRRRNYGVVDKLTLLQILNILKSYYNLKKNNYIPCFEDQRKYFIWQQDIIRSYFKDWSVIKIRNITLTQKQRFEDKSKIKKQIAFYLTNSAELDDLDHLVMSHEFIKKLSNHLDSNNKTIIQGSLQGIFEFIKEVIIINHLVQYDEKFLISKKLIKVQKLQKSSIILNSFIQSIKMLIKYQAIKDI
ncbi:unnamed protein product [Paramecium primaurelia]|uniref:Uncharacterized protein n=1 Tax=Paramecium primaurelia TaxID=5886 RepID=A0A8S1NKC3_PARPR|nr:unnamed protein product [Paramecium primaurelia]